MTVWPNPSFGSARCSTCNVWIETGDTCTHCDRIHVRRVLEKHGDSAGVCGPCATQAATQAARTRAGGDRVDVGTLYDDVLRHKAGLPATCDKAGALDVELCDEPVKPDLFGPNRSERVEVNRKDFELGPLSFTYPEELPADYFDPFAVELPKPGPWSVREMFAHVDPYTLAGARLDESMARHPAGNRRAATRNDDVDTELETIAHARALLAVAQRRPHGPASAAIFHALGQRLGQLEAAALAKQQNTATVDQCDPSTGYHSTPHVGCILR